MCASCGTSVESMLVLEAGKYLGADRRAEVPEGTPVRPPDRNLPVPVGRSVEQAERELILRALLDIKGNMMESEESACGADADDSIHSGQISTPGRFVHGDGGRTRPSRCRRWNTR